MIASTIEERNPKARIEWKESGGYAEGLTDVLARMVDAEGEYGGARHSGGCYLYRVNMIGAPLAHVGACVTAIFTCVFAVGCTVTTTLLTN